MVKSKMAATMNDFLSSIEKKNNSVPVVEDKENQDSVVSGQAEEISENIVSEVPKKRRGRKARISDGHRFTLVMSETMYQECLERAEKDFLSVNQYINQLIRNELNREQE